MLSNRDNCRKAKSTLLIVKRQFETMSKLKEFADDNSRLDENGEKFSKKAENAKMLWEKEKLLATSFHQ